MDERQQKITPFLWFEDEAEDAAKFYVSIFGGDSRILNVSRYRGKGPGKKGSVMTVSFKIRGQILTALNGGPSFKFTPAISFYVDCKDQAEVDKFWNKLSANKAKEQCGWLVDKFGLSWQIIPRALPEMLNDPDPEKVSRVTQAMLQMKKIDVQALESAYNQKG
jgi:predicted 3-demethylubiquinone-9 3-methyltransferase (glyoxalase superfamily)